MVPRAYQKNLAGYAPNFIQLRMPDICVIVISTQWTSLLTIILDITHFRVFSQFFS